MARVDSSPYPVATCLSWPVGVLRWVYRNPYSILDPAAVDLGKGSRNGSVNSFTSDVPRSYQPRLRYNHMATLAHMPNGSISAQWQVQP